MGAGPRPLGNTWRPEACVPPQRRFGYTKGVDLFTLLKDAASKAPDAPALITDDGIHDYRSALALVEAMAAALHERGVRRGGRIAGLCANTKEHFVAYFAAARLGAIFVPLNWRLSLGEMAAVVAHAEADMLLHERPFAEAAAALAKDGLTALLVDDALASGSCAAAPPAVEATADDVAQLYYTSGTTGAQKGVMLTHGNVASHAAAAVQELGLTAQDRWAHIAPMFHLADAWATFAVTQAGGAHVFLPKFAPAAALDLLARHAVTITNLVPTMLNLMVKEPGAGRRRFALRAMLSGGAPIAPEVVRQALATFRCEYVQTYGMTETSPYLTLSLLDAAQRALPEAERLRLICRTGRPFLGVDLRVVRDDGAPIAHDDREVGEIRVQGPTVTKGYWRNPEATAAAFDAQGYLCTGDLATVDAHGFVNIVDRKKDVIKTGGETVFSTEVENVLYQHPAILECAVYGQPDSLWGEIVAAAVVLRPGAAASEEELIAFCRGSITHYKAPRAVRFLAELPKTGSGKVQKRRLREG
jgi:fatty-acyl-CoA synthase